MPGPSRACRRTAPPHGGRRRRSSDGARGCPRRRRALSGPPATRWAALSRCEDGERIGGAVHPGMDLGQEGAGLAGGGVGVLDEVEAEHAGVALGLERAGDPAGPVEHRVHMPAERGKDVAAVHERTLPALVGQADAGDRAAGRCHMELQVRRDPGGDQALDQIDQVVLAPAQPAEQSVHVLTPPAHHEGRAARRAHRPAHDRLPGRAEMTLDGGPEAPS